MASTVASGAAGQSDGRRYSSAMICAAIKHGSAPTQGTGSRARSLRLTPRHVLVRAAANCAITIDTCTDGAENWEITSMIPVSEIASPNTVNLTVPQRQSRRYLTEKEIERLMDCARKYARHGHRDATMILVAYRRGLRASEVCDLQWHQIELSEGRLHVRRVKNGMPSVHPDPG
jgi:integrase